MVTLLGRRKFLEPFLLLYSKAKTAHKRHVLNRLAQQERIFILGVQKSGTTAIAALLAEATGLRVTLDIVRSIKRPGSKILRNYGAEGFDDYIYRYRREFSNRIVKEPGLTFDYMQLRAYFPKAQFVMIIREPEDNIRSILDRLKLPGNLSHVVPDDWPELKRSPAWRMNLDSSWLGHWPANYVDSLAYRWKVAAETYLSSPESFLLVRYEDFLKEKVGIIEKMSDALGLKVVRDVSTKVDRQFQPKGARITNYKEYYGSNYQYIQEHCSALARELDYTDSI